MKELRQLVSEAELTDLFEQKPATSTAVGLIYPPE